MDELIISAIDSVDKTLKSCPWWLPDNIKTQLTDTRRLLIRLCKSDLPMNNWTRLFCQQLKRLIDYNDVLPHEVWAEIHNDILYLLEVGKDEQGISHSWNRFIKRMNFEEVLEQRRLQHQSMKKNQKSLSDLLHDHKEFFVEYLQKCISLHATVQVQGLIENTDDFLCEVFGVPENLLSSNSRKRLKERLKCITVPLEFSSRSLGSLGNNFFQVNNAYTEINKDPNNFLPSQQLEVKNIGRSKMIESILGLNRWIVILGDPGSAKTTLLRWITHVFAEAASRNREKVDLEGDCCLPVRVPILIRISEFAEWLSQNETKTLIDYIGKQTWFSERYCDDENGTVLKELIYHGHALILLDGLDEVSGDGQRSTIVDLVEIFIDQYVRATDFISAFDDVLFDASLSLNDRKVLETQPPSISGGNQLVITSRIVGYQFRPLKGPFIRHYSLLLMNHQEADKFVKIWMTKVGKSIEDILLSEGIKLDEQILKSFTKRTYDAKQAIFENNSDLLQSNPFLLSLICTFIFQSSLEFNPKSRIEVYNHAVQTVLRAWTSQESKNLENALANFLINLATYLHLQSSSGLIDGFDIEHLCIQTLKQHKITNNRAKLHEYTRKIISLLESNTIIVVEKGLQTFGFLHLSFQEYFVAQGLVRGSSVEDVVARILSFTIKSRFRESFRLALGWISWKWPFDKYENFCNLLFTRNEKQFIPFGVLLFFDAITDLHCLPSNSIIFIALNSLLHHSFHVIREKFLISSLSKLPEDVIKEWIQSYLKDDKCLLDFCLSFLRERDDDNKMIENVRQRISSVIYQQLWLLHSRNLQIEFVIDQILQRQMISDDLSDQIFNKDLSTYLTSHNISLSNLHPLIFSVIIATCGGICLRNEKTMMKIDFSPKKMHRESSIVTLIIEYFNDNENSHETKIQTLITQYESILQQSLPCNTSTDIVDTLIALICLQGLSQPSVYLKYYEYQALPLALNKLKRTWFYLIKSLPFLPFDIDLSSIRSDIASFIKVCSLMYDQSEKQCISFPLACDSVWKKFSKWGLSHSLNFRFNPNDQVNLSSNFPQEFIDDISNEKLDLITQYISPLQIIQQKPLYLINFLPQSLRQLHYYTTISPTNQKDTLPFVVFLSQCLTYLDEVNKNYVNDCFALSVLQPLCKEYMLESYLLILFQEKYTNTKSYDENSKKFLKSMKDHHLLDSFSSNQSDNWEILIDVERQRIHQVTNVVQNQEKDTQIFIASISLARLFQAQHRIRKDRAMSDTHLISDESKEINFAITHISDPLLRTISWSIILDMKDPLIFDEEQRYELRGEMINLLQHLLPDLSLLKATLLFVRCYSSLKVFPTTFQHITSLIINKFNETSTDSQSQQQQEAAYIALQQLNNPDLSNGLMKFIKQKKSWSDLFQHNSNGFYQYFVKTASFDSSNTILLAYLYIVELAFDAEFLNMYTLSTHKIQISRLTELRELWNDSSKEKKVMTFPVASWITSYLRTSSNTEEINQIIVDVSCCSVIERKALSLMEEWLDFRTSKHLQCFAYYAALQLVAEGVNIVGLIDIIEGMFVTDRYFCLQPVIERLLTSASSSLPIIRQILILLQRHDRFSRRIFLSIECRELLELVLSLEQEQLISTRPFLSIIKSCTEDLQLYLVEHLRLCIDMCRKVKDTTKEEYVAVVVKWIIERLMRFRKQRNFSTELYEYIFVLLHEQQFPKIQKVIVIALGSVFFNDVSENQTSIFEIQMQPFFNAAGCKIDTGEVQIECDELSEGVCSLESDFSPIVLNACQPRENNFTQSDTLTNLEKLICLWDMYSEDVIAVCLLAYANCLLMLQRFDKTGNISDEVIDVLVNLSATSSSDIISMGATFCLTFTQHSSIICRPISTRYKKASDMTPEMRYKLLLYQASLITLINLNEIVRHIETYFDELINMFLTDLYIYLCNGNINNYLADPAPDYIDIAVRLMRENRKKFYEAVQKSSFGEKEFQNRLCLCFKNHKENVIFLIELCLFSGIVTFEFVALLEYIEDDKFPDMLVNLNHVKQVSDRTVIDELFQAIDRTVSARKLGFLLDLLQQLAENDIISLSEVHQQISLLQSVSSQAKLEFYKGNLIFDFLLNLSCFKTQPTLTTKENLFTEAHIEEEFKKEIQKHDKNSTMFLRGIFYLNDSESNSYGLNSENHPKFTSDYCTILFDDYN